MLVLLALAVRALWIEVGRYQLREVPAGQVSAVFPVGTRVLVTRTPVARLSAGDVIDYRHPASPGTALYVRVASVAASRTSSGYALTLQTGVPAAEAWHAEIHGAAWRVVVSREPAAWARDLALTRWVAGVLALGSAGLTVLVAARRWYRVRRRAVVRTYRSNICEHGAD